MLGPSGLGGGSEFCRIVSAKDPLGSCAIRFAVEKGNGAEDDDGGLVTEVSQ